MSGTRKDRVEQATQRVSVEVLKNQDGTYEVLFNGELVRSRVEERWLEQEVCVRYGFCGREFDDIMEQLSESGKAKVIL